jgi:hypothetical protein
MEWLSCKLPSLLAMPIATDRPTPLSLRSRKMSKSYFMDLVFHDKNGKFKPSIHGVWRSEDQMNQQ